MQLKEMVEEYGGVIAASVLGILLLSVLSELMKANGEINILIRVFLEGAGAICRF
jgi:hypothetical protein